MIQDLYPRVLIVMMTKVKADDPGNLLIRAEFGDWPKDRLAQIHAAGETAGHGEFCGRYYPLQAGDRAFGGLFQRLRGGVFEMVAADAVEDRTHALQTGIMRRWLKLAKKRLGDLLIRSGVWELIFRIRISKQMVRFIEDFKPDLVYCQGYSLGFATLPRLIARRFQIPLCFQTTDDWPSYAYRYFPLNWLLRRQSRRLVAEAKVRLAFGEKMQRKFESRYGVHFESTYHLDDPCRFAAESGKNAEPFRIVYTGNLALRRTEAFQDLLDAVRKLRDRAKPIQIMIYCSGLPKDTPRELLEAPEVQFLPLPTHAELPGILGAASLLFLPESFNIDVEMIEYAISSKVHIYMMSGRPILVYGPAYSGTVQYAASEGWASVVDKRSPVKLEEALMEFIDGGDWTCRLRQNADACVKRNHDLAAGRERFREMLAAAVNSSGTAEGAPA